MSKEDQNTPVCKRNSVTPLREFRTIGLEKSGYDHDRGKLCAPTATGSMSPFPKGELAIL